MKGLDDRGADGLSWTLDEKLTRTSHALADGGRVFFLDPVDEPTQVDRALELGRPAAVIQLLDRHRRDCASLAERLEVEHLVVPRSLPGTPFEVVEIRRGRWWQEVALWWPAHRTLVVADAIGTNAFYTAGRGAAGVHLLLRLTPPRRQLAGFEPEHLLVGHGAPLHGDAAREGLRQALARSRRDLPRVLLKLPTLG